MPTTAADTPIRNTRFTAIDFESAGELRGETDVPVQIGAASMQGIDILPDSFFRSYMRSDRPITWKAAQVHGITRKDLAHAPTFQELWPGLQARLNRCILVAHSAGTERKFLRTFALHDFGPWIDTLHLVRGFYPQLPAYALGDLIRSFGLETEVRTWFAQGNWHDALFDAVASLVLLRHVVQQAALHDYPATALTRPDTAAYFRHRSSPPRN